jgi:hypothetical protein
MGAPLAILNSDFFAATGVVSASFRQAGLTEGRDISSHVKAGTPEICPARD